MPIYEFKCGHCNHKQSGLFSSFVSFDDRRLEDSCESCQSCDWQPAISLPQKHSSWESTGKWGVNGYFSGSLGRFVDNPAKERAIMEKKGFIAESDLPKNWWSDKTNQQKEKIQKQDQLADQYLEKVKSGKTKEEAVAETWTAKDAVSGELDKIYDTSISKEN